LTLNQCQAKAAKARLIIGVECDYIWGGVLVTLMVAAFFGALVDGLMD